MYTIKLPNFEGPLDLLLFFIKRDELDIYDIPIARITREFLDFIRLMQLFDLELAGEFLVMASSLMQIKVRMLLPKEVDEKGEELPGEDPRAELVQQLLQYSQYKEVSREFAEREEDQRYIYYRQMFDAEVQTHTGEEEYKNATLFDLLAAFKKALERRPAQITLHTVQLYPISIEEQTENILMRIRSEKRLSFVKLVENQPRLYIVVTFLAMLEMSKNQIISIRQNDNFEDIEIVPFEDIIETKSLEEVLHPLQIVGSQESDEQIDEQALVRLPDEASADDLSANDADQQASNDAKDSALDKLNDEQDTVVHESTDEDSDNDSEENSDNDSDDDSDDDSDENPDNESDDDSDEESDDDSDDDSDENPDNESDDDSDEESDDDSDEESDDDSDEESDDDSDEDSDDESDEDSHDESDEDSHDESDHE